ncbi:MAG TPA: histidine phosphatase family protein [Gammaproteobacteria bacterium]
MQSRPVFLIAVLLLALLPACAVHAPDAVPTVYIVRHAEKADGKDPALSTAGAARAGALAARLEGAGVTRIFSTDTLRTRSTAAPLAERLGLITEIYDHRQPAKLVESIRSSGETVLVVGHSNTIAQIATAFGVDAGPAVRDDEYDRLYVIALDAGGPAVQILRYGNP